MHCTVGGLVQILAVLGGRRVELKMMTALSRTAVIFSCPRKGNDSLFVQILLTLPGNLLVFKHICQRLYKAIIKSLRKQSHSYLNTGHKTQVFIVQCTTVRDFFPFQLEVQVEVHSQV